jgi:uncharacterized membrane protein
MRTGVRVLLIVSLAINLLVAGVIAGGLIMGPMGGRPPGVDLTLGPFARALAPDDRRAIARDLMERADLGPMRRSERQADLAELAAALRADPFDSAALAEIMARQRARVRSLEGAVEAAVLERLSAMTAEERAGVADRLEREMDHRHRDGD